MKNNITCHPNSLFTISLVLILFITGMPGLVSTGYAQTPWTQRTDMPMARGAHGAATVNGKIYVIGGYGSANLTEEYDPATDTWTTKADMPTPRADFYCCVAYGKIYVIGGEITEEYDPSTETWNDKAPMSTPRWLLSTSVVDGKIYAIGGQTVAGLFSTVEEYTPEGWPFAVSSQERLTTTWGKIKSN